ncbi:DUF1045 domain-containing protein [Marimonas sp. MJW-29]|uniref:DUF1045 domain-containing protein n=1 Tax=Sulfitobacter sediminis TaxID=3234186 RepID=A0ABV3RRM1_9RHOB
MFTRYAVYFTADGMLGARGAAWLGWDIAMGAAMPQPGLSGIDLAAVTEKPRRYGFHGTIKPPFALKDELREDALQAAFGALCKAVRPVVCEALEVSRLGRFLALTPVGDASDLKALAAKVVRDLDCFRAPPTEAELARRRGARLTPAQEENLTLWGYPHVMDQFRFHMTLSGRMKDLSEIQETAERYFAPVLARPFRMDSLTLVGERPDGTFVNIARRELGR